MNKIKTAVQAAEATAYNYCQDKVSHTDQPATSSNQEFVNMDKRDYWEVASVRLAKANITPRRLDAVRCVEAFLTASPDFFKCGDNGLTTDYAQSDWLKDTRTFLIEKFGEENLIAFQIHQGVKPPYIHAVIVPITTDGRLSTRKIFSPAAIYGYYCEYTELIKRYGL